MLDFLANKKAWLPYLWNKLSFLKSLGCKPPSILISREMTLKDNHKMKTFLIIITHAGKSKNVLSAIINAVNI